MLYIQSRLQQLSHDEMCDQRATMIPPVLIAWRYSEFDYILLIEQI